MEEYKIEKLKKEIIALIEENQEIKKDLLTLECKVVKQGKEAEAMAAAFLDYKRTDNRFLIKFIIMLIGFGLLGLLT